MDKENKLAPNAEPQQPTGSTVKRLARLFSTKKQSSAAPADCQGAIERTEAGSLYHRLDNTRLRGSSSSSSPGSNSRVSTAPPGSHSELGLAVGSSYERPGEVRVRPAADRKTELGPGALLAVPKLQWESPQAGAQPRLMSVKDVRASENDVCSKPTPSSLRLRPHSNHKVPFLGHLAHKGEVASRHHMQRQAIQIVPLSDKQSQFLCSSRQWAMRVIFLTHSLAQS